MPEDGRKGYLGTLGWTVAAAKGHQIPRLDLGMGWPSSEVWTGDMAE